MVKKLGGKPVKGPRSDLGSRGLRPSLKEAPALKAVEPFVAWR